MAEEKNRRGLARAPMLTPGVARSLRRSGRHEAAHDGVLVAAAIGVERA